MSQVPPYDLSPFLDVPEELLTYHEVLRQPLPAGVNHISCSRSGELFAAGTKLLRLDDQGQVLTSANLDEPATALDACCDQMAIALPRRVQVYDRELQLLQDGANLGENASLVSVALDRDRIAASDFGQRRIWLLDGLGNPKNQIDGVSADSSTGFRLPSPYFPCTFGPDDQLWVSHTGMQRVEHWQGTKLVAHFGQTGMSIERFCGCCNPVNLAILPGGDLITVEKGLPRIKRYTQDGKLVAVIAPPRSFELTTRGIGLAVHPTGRIWVSDPKRQQLIAYEEQA